MCDVMKIDNSHVTAITTCLATCSNNPSTPIYRPHARPQTFFARHHINPHEIRSEEFSLHAAAYPYPREENNLLPLACGVMIASQPQQPSIIKSPPSGAINAMQAAATRTDLGRPGGDVVSSRCTSPFHSASIMAPQEGTPTPTPNGKAHFIQLDVFFILVLANKTNKWLVQGAESRPGSQETSLSAPK